jgi:hypothetical protein
MLYTYQPQKSIKPENNHLRSPQKEIWALAFLTRAVISNIYKKAQYEGIFS